MGNHIADQGQKEYADKSSCPNCKHILESIDWCIDNSAECTCDCDSFHEGMDCPHREERVRCNRCEKVYEVD